MATKNGNGRQTRQNSLNEGERWVTYAVCHTEDKTRLTVGFSREGQFLVFRSLREAQKYVLGCTRPGDS